MRKKGKPTRRQKESEEIYYNKLFVINELRYLFHSSRTYVVRDGREEALAAK